jgi:hypothetical protein
LLIVIKASAPVLSAKTWYEMRAFAKDGKVLASSKAGRRSHRGALVHGCLDGVGELGVHVEHVVVVVEVSR